MSRILTLKKGIKYLKNQREKSEKPEKIEYYNKEIERLEKKLYYKEVEMAFDRYDKNQNTVNHESETL